MLLGLTIYLYVQYILICRTTNILSCYKYKVSSININHDLSYCFDSAM